MRTFFLLFLLLISFNVYAHNSSWVSWGGGILRPDDPRGAYLIDGRSPLFLKVLRGQIGVIGEGVKSGYAFGGIGFETPLLGGLYCYLNFSPGVYFEHNGFPLSFPVEFRSSVDLIYQFSHCLRIGSAFFHISNANLGRRNPGMNGIILYLSRAI